MAYKDTSFWKHPSGLTLPPALPCGTSYISLAKRAEGDQQIQRDNFSLIISPLFMFKREFM